MRIASLLPSATEIVCALGAGHELVGRSHECDFPQGLEHVPVLTRARIGPLPTSHGIDAAVRDVLKDALAIYEIDLERLREAKPDVIVTQDLCEVCAVSLDDVRAAVARLAQRDVTIVNLHPMRLEDVWGDITRVAGALGREEIGARVVADLRARVDAIAARGESAGTRPTMLSVEWIDPVMIGGLWMPEMIALAGATPMVTAAGDHAPTLTRDQLAALDPDVLLIKPCGFPIARTLDELSTLRRVLPWEQWRCVANGRVFVADGNAYFNRPGPRIVESLEIMAACASPDVFSDLARKNRDGFVAVSRDLAVTPV